ncbi:MAG: M81 family metallopeptidase [Pseudomonadota bacterium]
MKIVSAIMQHETNTFSSLPTPYEAFAGATGLGEPPRGEAAIAAYGAIDCPFAAFLDLAKAEGAEVVVPIAAYAEPSGPVERAAFEAISEQICAAVAAGCDAVMLDLHGAMVCEHSDDGEGELLRRIRQIAPDLPVAVALDFHSHMTADMADNATVITGYRTYPHVDMYETGRRAGATLLRALRGEVRPRILWDALPMITHLLRQTPSAPPMAGIMAQAVEAEAQGAVLNASVFGGFPYADIPHVSLSAVLVADEHREAAARDLLDELLSAAWGERERFVFEAEPLARSIAHAKTLDGGPVVVADHGDNSGAGGSADDMSVIAEMLDQGLEDILAGPIWDPEAVAQLHAAGHGAEVTVTVGGKTATPDMGLKGRSLTLTGKVWGLSDGRFTITGPMMTGLAVDLGRTAVLESGPLQLIVSEQRCEPTDLGYLAHTGLVPTDKKYLVLKSRQHFRAGFEKIARHIVLAAGPGVCGSDYSQFPFRRLKRPIYPLDDFADHTATA